MVTVGAEGGAGLCLARGGAEDRSEERPAGLDVRACEEGMGCLAKDSDEPVAAEETGFFEKFRSSDGGFASCVEDDGEWFGCCVGEDLSNPCSNAERSSSSSMLLVNSGIRCAAMMASADDVKNFVASGEVSSDRTGWV